MNPQEITTIVAPALRALTAESDTLNLVSFNGSDTCSPDALEITIPESADSKAIVEALRSALASQADTPAAVRIANVGTFTIQPAPKRAGRIAGKVAVVTGAAQGFGLKIAEELAEEGASVILADINADGVKAAAAELSAKYDDQRAIGVAMNVTDLDSIKQAVTEAVSSFGGIDLFISNAGVLKAESVKSQALADFEFVTKVNYTGYFLCVQAVSPVMAVQHLARPSYRSDIVQINSKSGLEGSNRNGAYAGSKFGGIGLTQSFALELIEDGIKVNSICPGNFFDGPLWSNPDNGLFVQYLNTGKVPGAKTIADVREFYEKKVPMGRGCLPGDVMKAVYYLMEQQYETGQAVPVTGGQIMLS